MKPAKVVLGRYWGIDREAVGPDPKWRRVAYCLQTGRGFLTFEAVAFGSCEPESVHCPFCSGPHPTLEAEVAEQEGLIDKKELAMFGRDLPLRSPAESPVKRRSHRFVEHGT